MEELEPTKYTPEQLSEIRKAIFKTRVSVLWAMTLHSGILFAINFLTITLGALVFKKDSDPDFIAGYLIATTVINVCFVSIFFVKKLNKLGDVLRDKVKEILNKQS